MIGLYDYTGTPPGWGDTFFQYVFDAQDNPGVTDGGTFMQLGVQINDGKFVMRYWSGLGTIAESVQIYDWMLRKFASNWMSLGATNQLNGRGQVVVFPEVVYPDGGNIRFDLQDVSRLGPGNVGGVDVFAAQMVFTGVRRRQGVVSDPEPSPYSYKEVEFSYPYTLAVNVAAASGGQFSAPIRTQIPVLDYDFELRQVIFDNHSAPSPFKITMYDQYKVQMSNRPVLSNQFFRSLPAADNTGELNFWPCPPMLYKVNSVIQFDVFSLLAAPTQTYHLTFKGVRRIPC